MISSCRNGIILWFLLSSAILLSNSLQNLQAQSGCDQQISVDFRGQRLDNILDSITRLTGLKFSYNSALIDSTDVLSFRMEHTLVCTLIDSLLGRYHLTWTRLANQIIITSPSQVPPVAPGEIENPVTVIRGKVIDKTDKQPIPYAYIRIMGKSIGTITNDDGDFVFKYPVSDDPDIVAISCVGYKTLTVPIPDFTDQHTWELPTESILLKEVLVRSVDPRSIIKKAIDAIPENYRTSPVMQTGFYRETLQKNGKYIVLSEAVVNIFKSAYNKPFQNDQVKVFKGRKTVDREAYDTVLYKVQGGLYNSLLLDIVKNRANFMDENSFPDYEFHMGLMQKINDALAYTIEFDQKEGVEDALFKGKLYVDVNTLAILGADFSISPRGMKNAASMLVKRASPKIKVKPVSVDYLVSYSRYSGKWQLSHIRMEMNMRVRKKNNLFNSLFTSVSEMVITRTDTLNAKPFRSADIARANEIFVDNIGPYDPAFWGDYNFIKPEEKLEETLTKIFRQQTQQIP